MTQDHITIDPADRREAVQRRRAKFDPADRRAGVRRTVWILVIVIAVILGLFLSQFLL